MLEHQINNELTRDQLQSLTRANLSVGGDHGGVKFQMTLKILFQFQERAIILGFFKVCLTVKMTPTFLMLLYCSPLENA
jgi:hypothetical protein